MNDYKDRFDELAGKYEFDAGLTREQAEKRAREDLRRGNGKRLSGTPGRRK